MTDFIKQASQSTKGWDSKHKSQIMKVGDNTEITLKIVSPADAKLEVTADDPTICTVHEKADLKSPAGRSFLITALTTGDTQISARPAKGVPPATMVHVHVSTSPHSFRLVFFPGERSGGGDSAYGSIYVIGGKGERFSAAGGPLRKKPDNGHIIEPTPPGHFTLGHKRHIVTSNWTLSAIPYGADLRLTAQGEVEFKGDTGGWKPATGVNGAVTLASMKHFKSIGLAPTIDEVNDFVLTRYFINKSTKQLNEQTWKSNDFGRWGWNLIRKGHATPFYIHTTPQNEEDTSLGKAVSLVNSHGCIHIKPVDRDRMMSLGYLKQGVDFEVRPYTEVGPP